MDRKEESAGGMDSWEETAVLIAQEIREWSAQVLEKSNPAFGNLPMCPYAKQAWLDSNIMIHVTSELTDVSEIKATFPPTDHLTHVIAWTGWDEMSADEFQQWINIQNKNHFGTWIVGFHPEADEDENAPEFEGTCGDDYAVILVQSYAYLVGASRALLRTKYYENYSPDDMKIITDRQEQFDAWNQKVNAKAFEASEERAIQARISGQETEH